MSTVNPCPECGKENTYFDGVMNNCPDCGHFWSVESKDEIQQESTPTVRDCEGTELKDGDEVNVIKDLPVKGSSLVVKRGTKVKNIRLIEDITHVDCRVDGIGAIFLKTEFVRKV